MPHRLNFADPDFQARVNALLEMKRESDADVDAAVAEIIADVRRRGAEAVAELTRRFDGFDVDAGSLLVTTEEIDAGVAAVPSEQAEALALAAERIRAYHERQLPEDRSWTDAAGAEIGWRWGPVDSAGLYVPGGLASYPSSVLMNAIPATVAGVKRLVMAAPTPNGELNPLVLLAARLSGVAEIYRMGGAQAIAAFAFGADPIPAVDKITGPGNAYVAAAKRRVYGQVGIDMIAGPSEICIIADADNNPDWLAMDLMSQAEHDQSAQSILITDEPGLAEAVGASVDRMLDTLQRRDVAGPSWRNYGALVVVRDLDQAADLTNRLSPEHLEICTADADAISRKIRHAGAIFLGPHTPEAIGDYVGGPNHVLPTARSARFSSGLSVLDFMKRTTIARMTPGALSAIGPAAETLAQAEGLEAHGLSVRLRLDAMNE